MSIEPKQLEDKIKNLRFRWQNATKQYIATYPDFALGLDKVQNSRAYQSVLKTKMDINVLQATLKGLLATTGNFIDYQIGRFATNWGEATFIPVGANGLVTNALDLDTLRSPGASIKEALLPTEQITLSTGLADGSSLEAYYQFSHDRVGLGVAGSYFGSELFGEGAKSLDASGTYGMERQSPDACPFTMTGGTEHTAAGFAPGMGMNCTSENVAAQSRHATNWTNHSTVQLAIDGLQKMTAQDLAWAQLTATAHEFTTGQDGLGGTDADSAGNLQSSTAGTFITSGIILVFFIILPISNIPLEYEIGCIHCEPT